MLRSKIHMCMCYSHRTYFVDAARMRGKQELGGLPTWAHVVCTPFAVMDRAAGMGWQGAIELRDEN